MRSRLTARSPNFSSRRSSPRAPTRGKAKAWVDRVYRERESQETRRILYVAATRAREELHLFARPAYNLGANDDLILVTPSNSLLATAWSALEDEIRTQFDAWKSTRKAQKGAKEQDAGAHETIESIAAVGASNLLVEAAEPPIQPTILRRLPDDYLRAPGASQSFQWEGQETTILKQPLIRRIPLPHNSTHAMKAAWPRAHWAPQSTRRWRSWPASAHRRTGRRHAPH